MQALHIGKGYQKPSDDVDTTAYMSLQLMNHELTPTVEGDIVLCDHRLFVSTTLQKEAINIAYEGHHGMVKTKALVRERIWFLGIDKMVEQCVICSRDKVGTIRDDASTSKTRWKEHYTKIKYDKYIIIIYM